ncbi:hypothetical protein [Anaplasma phagocytophilum]|nr:hypothetical protein [Anaplasma phagocytophilum]
MLDSYYWGLSEYTLAFSQCSGDEVISRRKVHGCGIGFRRDSRGITYST